MRKRKMHIVHAERGDTYGSGNHLVRAALGLEREGSKLIHMQQRAALGRRQQRVRIPHNALTGAAHIELRKHPGVLVVDALHNAVHHTRALLQPRAVLGLQQRHVHKALVQQRGVSVPGQHVQRGGGAGRGKHGGAQLLGLHHQLRANLQREHAED